MSALIFLRFIPLALFLIALSQDEWSGAIDQRQASLLKYLEHKYFIVQVEDTMSEKPFRAEIDKKRFRESLAE
jgi:hypothetical protein